jgi:hypothetical protein
MPGTGRWPTPSTCRYLSNKGECQRRLLPAPGDGLCWPEFALIRPALIRPAPNASGCRTTPAPSTVREGLPRIARARDETLHATRTHRSCIVAGAENAAGDVAAGQTAPGVGRVHERNPGLTPDAVKNILMFDGTRPRPQRSRCPLWRRAHGCKPGDPHCQRPPSGWADASGDALAVGRNRFLLRHSRYVPTDTHRWKLALRNGAIKRLRPTALPPPSPARNLQRILQLGAESGFDHAQGRHKPCLGPQRHDDLQPHRQIRLCQTTWD